MDTFHGRKFSPKLALVYCMTISADFSLPIIIVKIAAFTIIQGKICGLKVSRKEVTGEIGESFLQVKNICCTGIFGAFEAGFGHSDSKIYKVLHTCFCFDEYSISALSS